MRARPTIDNTVNDPSIGTTTAGALASFKVSGGPRGLGVVTVAHGVGPPPTAVTVKAGSRPAQPGAVIARPDWPSDGLDASLIHITPASGNVSLANIAPISLAPIAAETLIEHLMNASARGTAISGTHLSTGEGIRVAAYHPDYRIPELGVDLKDCVICSAQRAVFVSGGSGSGWSAIVDGERALAIQSHASSDGRLAYGVLMDGVREWLESQSVPKDLRLAWRVRDL